MSSRCSYPTSFACCCRNWNIRSTTRTMRTRNILSVNSVPNRPPPRHRRTFLGIVPEVSQNFLLRSPVVLILSNKIIIILISTKKDRNS